MDMTVTVKCFCLDQHPVPHPYITSGPDFEGERTYRFDEAVNEVIIPSHPNFLLSDESLQHKQYNQTVCCK